ncbi:hypothetical protein BDFB_005817 [Asbolus verrucosus]|uniref:Uncharacterized protein n=1 Tax=Asbolus verrucosus TaxID=1661398 RepID=A0A482W535_ASBVE|nr:hypothetical protein BDFB_005817 [Asbolus verrucosus]
MAPSMASIASDNCTTPKRSNRALGTSYKAPSQRARQPDPSNQKHARFLKKAYTVRRRLVNRELKVTVLRRPMRLTCGTNTELRSETQPDPQFLYLSSSFLSTHFVRN